VIRIVREVANGGENRNGLMEVNARPYSRG
jgi:hypothetical protein